MKWLHGVRTWEIMACAKAKKQSNDRRVAPSRCAVQGRLPGTVYGINVGATHDKAANSPGIARPSRSV